ncbi:MAG: acyl-CoA dehydrogenase family protein [Thermoplasmataceae archaeon]
MDFELNEELKEFKKKVREFALKEFPMEIARKHDYEESYPEEIRVKSLNTGIIDFSNPWKTMVAVEELCRVDAGLGISITVPYFGAEVIMLFGNDKQKEKYLSPVNKGTQMMGLAVTEPGGGSDVAANKTEATKVGDNFILSGSKMFITNGQIADFFVMLARTSKIEGEKKHRGMSAFIVESKFKGFSASKLEGKLGVRATNTAELILNNVEVPSENLIGEEGKGFYYIMTFFNISRVFVAAQAIGVAQGALDRTLEYLKKYAPKEENQKEHVQFTLSDMATRIEAARLIMYKAASYLFQFKPNPTITSMAKGYASETAVFVAEKAMELTGLYGLDGDLERYFRDAKIMEIWEGTSEVEKLIIARMIAKEGDSDE